MDLRTALRPAEAEPVATSLPLKLNKGVRIALVGNTLFERAQDYGHFEALLQQAHPKTGRWWQLVLGGG